MQGVKGISVTQLNTYIKGALLSEDMLSSIYVCGEIGGLKFSAGHAYFLLKDENSSISCVCFSYAKTYIPKEGELVALFGSVDYYIKRGSISFNIVRIEPLGKGILQAQFEELKSKLTTKGYFSVERKKPIPQYCRRVGVITSRTGAVIRDIITTARKNNGLIDIFVHDVRVQGVDAVGEIIRAIMVADGMGYDAIIIARGGGSIEDLLPFNSEELVYAIYSAKTPIISAVGHETDFTLCDFVADVRVPTPTAAAELIAYSVRQLAAWFLTATNTIKKLGLSRVDFMTDRLTRVIKDIMNAARNIVEHKTNQLNSMVAALDSNNPARILLQGYFKIKKDGIEQHGVTNLKTGDEVVITGHDGKVTAWISNKA